MVGNDEALNVVFQDYLQTAEKLGIKVSWSNLGIGVTIAGTVVGLMAIFIGGIVQASRSISDRSSGTPVPGIIMLVFCAVVVLIIVSGIQKNRRIRAYLKDCDRKKPGFREFYRVWAKDRRKANNRALLGALFVTGAAAAGAVEEYRRHHQTD